MMKIAMSPAASALLRILTARAGVERNRILLIDAHSREWQSLTFAGERHHLQLRVTGCDSGEVTARIGVIGEARRALDGATELDIEALTITSD